MRWTRTGWPPASTMAAATAKPAFSALAVTASIIFLAPASVRRLEFATYIGPPIGPRIHGNGGRAFPSIITRIFHHSRGPSMKHAPGQTDHTELRGGVRTLCKQFDSAYWQKVDEARGYPAELVKALTEAGWLAALIPEEYGGSGLSVTEASIILEEISHSGAFAGAVHGQMYVMGCVLRHASQEQKRSYLPRIASGELRM